MMRIRVTAAALGVLALSVLSGCGPEHVTKPAQAPVASPSANRGSGNLGNGVGSQGIRESGILMVGQNAPDESLISEKTMQTVKLSSFIGQKPLIINAWASWCAPCQEEAPNFVKMDAKYGSKVQFLGVNLTSMDTVQKAKSFVAKYGIQYPVVLDTHGTFYRDYTVIAEPMTYVVSLTGKVLSIHVGSLQTAQIAQLVKQALTQH